MSRAADAKALAGASGALVVSLDFELAWGVRDIFSLDGPYRANLLGAREAVPRILDLLAEYGVAATWATVGFLFAESREELEHYSPKLRPRYASKHFDPYADALGGGEADDPLRYAPSLIAQIAATPRQEIASHTFSHYYCLEAGQSADEFAADLASAVAVAKAHGHVLKSLVFPRNQLRTDYLPLLARTGFTAFRGTESNFLNRPRPGASGSPVVRGLRAADVFVSLTGSGAVPWSAVKPLEGVVNVPSSRFLRPWQPNSSLEALRWQRVASSMEAAARGGALFHLWWHPHNFGVNLEQNLHALKRHLELYARLRDKHGFASHTMAEVADLVRTS